MVSNFSKKCAASAPHCGIRGTPRHKHIRIHLTGPGRAARKTPYAPVKLNSKSANGGQARKIDASTYTVTGLSRDAARCHTGQCGETHRNPPITGHVVGHILCPARDPPSRAQPNGYRKYTTCEYSYSAHRVRITQAASPENQGIFREL